MERGQKYRCLVLPFADLKVNSLLIFNSEIEQIRVNSLKEAISTAQNKFINCIILLGGRQPDSVYHAYKVLSAQLASLPVLVILDKYRLELACRLGQLGARYVVSCTDSGRIETLLKQILDERKYRREGFLNPDSRHFSILVRNAIHIIENRYPGIGKVKEIAGELQVTEAYLCREFKRQCGVSCKKILLFLKIRHAVKLLNNVELSIKEISYDVGFSRPKRFSETFHKLTGITPSDYRRENTKQMENDFLQKIWQNIKKTEAMSKKRN